MVDKTVTVEFSSSDDLDIAVDLDDLKNLEVYGEVRSQFQYGEKCYFRVYPFPTDLALTFTVSDGIISDEGSGTEIVQNEILSFSGTDSATTAKPISEITSYTWQGEGRGEPTFSGGLVTIPDPAAGVLKLTYTTEFLRKALSLGVRDETVYPVVVLISGEAP